MSTRFWLVSDSTGNSLVKIPGKPKDEERKISQPLTVDATIMQNLLPAIKTDIPYKLYIPHWKFIKNLSDIRIVYLCCSYCHSFGCTLIELVQHNMWVKIINDTNLAYSIKFCSQSVGNLVAAREPRHFQKLKNCRRWSYHCWKGTHCYASWPPALA